MKKLLILSVIIALNFNAFAQSPQRMSYQAVVRKTTGELMINQAVGMKISILQGSATGTPVYVETHTTTTNSNGMATIEIGGGTIVSGTFTGIDWTSGTYYIKTETDPTGGTNYSITGTSQILSVPYALYSKVAKTANYNDLTNKPTTLSGYGITDAVSIAGTQTISGTTTFKGTTPDMEEALFDVKNKDGQTIFAVYNEGVRIWVADGAKGSKGGFAVGGFDMTKGNTGNYFNISTRSEADTINGESRVMWYPVKEAFRSGNVLIESKDSVGLNSWASGYQSKAIGDYSQALGFQAIARKDYSTAIGYQAVANKRNSFAFGQWATAKNEEGYAFGRGAIAEGKRSFAFGSEGVDSAGQVTGVAYAKGDYSFAIGQGSQALGTGAFAIGLSDTATGNYSTAIGYMAKASEWYATSMGYNTTASGEYSTAFGYNTTASSYHSTAMGSRTTASGYNSTAIGSGTIASGTASTAMGSRTTASGTASNATGNFTAASGINSTAMGNYTTASGHSSTAMGYLTTAYGSYSTAMGVQTTASGSHSTAMGFRTTASRSYSTTLGYNTTASGYDGSSAMGYYTTASGTSSIAIGRYSKANTYAMMAVGRYNDTIKYHGYSSCVDWFDDDPLFVIGNGTADNNRGNAFTVIKNGNIGIGNSVSPTAKLEVNLGNSSGWSGNLKALRVYAPDNAYYLDLNTSIISAGNTGYHFNPNGNTGITISTPGNVGIGYNAPEYRLDVLNGTLGSSLNAEVLWERVSGLAQPGGNHDQLRIYHRRFIAGDGWGNAETRIQKTIDVTNMGYISFKADYLEFGGGYGGNTYMTLRNGNLGIGNSDPGYRLVVNGTAWCSSGSWSGSDIRWKKNISEITNVLSSVLQLTPVSYELKKEEFPELNFTEGTQVGLIAQDLENIFPQLVSTDNNGYKGIAYDKLSAILVQAVKEQQQQIDSQQQQIDELKGMVKVLMNR